MRSFHPLLLSIEVDVMSLDCRHIVRCCREQPIRQSSESACNRHLVADLGHVRFTRSQTSRTTPVQLGAGSTVQDGMCRRAVLVLVEVEVNVPLLDLRYGLGSLVGCCCRSAGVRSALRGSVVLDVRVRAWEKEALSARIGPAHQVRRLAGRAVHLYDLTISDRRTHCCAGHHNAITYLCVHVLPLLTRRSAALDLDPLLGRLAARLRHPDLQHPVPVSRRDNVRSGAFGQSDLSYEASVPELAAIALRRLVLPFLATFCADGQDTVVDRHIDVPLRIDTG